MNKLEIQSRILKKLANFSKWNEAHTEEINALKVLPKHMRGSKLAIQALEELYKLEFILKYHKTGETHISLNIRKKKEIEELLDL